MCLALYQWLLANEDLQRQQHVQKTGVFQEELDIELEGQAGENWRQHGPSPLHCHCVRSGHSRSSRRFKRGVTERGGFAFACQYMCLSTLPAVPDRQWYCHCMQHPLHPIPCRRTTKLHATIACQYSVGALRRGGIVLSSRLPRTCRYHLFAYPLFDDPLSAREASKGTQRKAV